MEIGVWQSLYRFIFRRPSAPRGALVFGYDRPVRSVLIVFVVLSALEVPIVDLIVHPWPAARIPLLIFGIWGVTFMVGLLLGFITRPHVVGPDGIRIRHGAEIEVDLPWELVASVARRDRPMQFAKTFSVQGTSDHQILNHSMQDRTRIDIVLERPIEVRLPSASVIVRELRISVDDPRGFMDAVKQFIP